MEEVWIFSGTTQSILPTKVRYKTDDELTLFGASNFGNKSFNHAVQI